ncbi:MULTISPECIES: universal stress protein [Rhizobium]|uniref:Nucleotide-binding universal stress UspA family protein n=1 Tax=Rhizobium paranaense TaxID=1650438 RepID=A0A7W8XV07_9HYPH|nr:universal stress protein [Rhizobium paranaense]MBB5575925.1 nucleotide-binding universal stress UspA family protein [Rhizobium paranaense]
MRYKTILAPVGVNQFQEDIKNAIAVGQSAGAHLAVTVVALAAPPPVGGYAEIISAAWLEERQGDLAKLADQVEIAKDMLEASGLSYDVQDLYTEFAWADEDIAKRALYADLTLVGRQAAQDQDLCKRILDGALFQSPTPVLFNPVDRIPNLTPRSVLIAWDSRMEAARAVQQALPMLQTAGEVHVTLIDPIATESNSGEEPGADIATYLARHGVSVAVDVVSGGGRTVDETLKQHAVDVAAELVVMGAYSHSRLREIIFGGVTQAMLETAKLPIFWSH